MGETSDDVRGWLTSFEAACRERDFATGRAMFHADAVAFGTWAKTVSGLDNIEREQWRNVWPRIRDFRFDAGPTIGVSGDSSWIASTWTSEATGPDGRAFQRAGRATFVLAQCDGRWLCVHSHVSLLPTQAENAHGRL